MFAQLKPYTDAMTRNASAHSTQRHFRCRSDQNRTSVMSQPLGTVDTPSDIRSRSQLSMSASHRVHDARVAKPGPSPSAGSAASSPH